MNSEIDMLRRRIMELEENLALVASETATTSTAPTSPATFIGEVFPARITADNADGTYTARRLVATAVNTFVDDSDDTATITLGCVAERSAYTGALSVGDIVLVRFDGLDDEAIYHVW